MCCGLQRNNACRAPAQSLAHSKNPTQRSFPSLSSSHFQLKTDPNQLKCPADCQILPPTRWLLSTVKWLQHPCKPRVFMEKMKFSFSCPILFFATLYTSYCYREVDPAKHVRNTVFDFLCTLLASPLFSHIRKQTPGQSSKSSREPGWKGGWKGQ